ncbi:MAG: hypothetical protein H6719_17015 [Sandaracinaceae bacterium]|nr:hypothetical protein [Sandaracinaceae bacterium]
MRPAVLALLLLAPAAAAAQPQAALQSPPDAVVEEEAPAFGEPIGLYDPSGQAMRSFHDALRRAENGEQARVVFYGASHVAADFFTNVVRERLQERFGDAGHGYLMPVRPWRHYRHLGGPTVESSRMWTAHRIVASSRDVEPLGFAGMAVEASHSSAWGRIDTGSATAGRFVVHYLRQPGGGSFDLRVDGRRVRHIVTAADETATGIEPIDGLTDEHHTLEVRARGDGPVRIFGVSVEREQAGVIVDTLGLNGARAVSQLLWQEDLDAPSLRNINPSLVVLAYGTNESGDDSHPIEDYETELWQVVGRMRGTVPNASCLLIGPSDRPRREDGELVDRPRTHQVIEVQRRVARAFGCGFFDLVEFGGGPLSMVRWAAADPPYAQRDLVHFTGRAYLRLGEVLHDAIMAGYEPESAPTGAPITIASGSR